MPRRTISERLALKRAMSAGRKRRQTTLDELFGRKNTENCAAKRQAQPPPTGKKGGGRKVYKPVGIVLPPGTKIPYEKTPLAFARTKATDRIRPKMEQNDQQLTGELDEANRPGTSKDPVVEAEEEDWVEIVPETPPLQTANSLGPELDSFQRFCAPPLPPLKAAANHKVLVKVQSVNKEGVPLPYPEQYTDLWDPDHVKMPCSPASEFPNPSPDGQKRVVPRWPLIQQALTRQFKSSFDIEEAILSYNGRNWRFRGLHKFFNEYLPKEEADELLSHLTPAMARLALRLPEICTQSVPLLKSGESMSMTLSQEQTACLLANAFFCTFPRRNVSWGHHKANQFANFPDINFNKLFGLEKSMEKLRCLFHYFKRVIDKMPEGLLTFERQGLTEAVSWAESDSKLTHLHVSSKGTIEDFGNGMLQIDFANKFLGGGVLGSGCVQEEIRFLICPELILSCLFTEALTDSECLIIKGCERFSYYTGYGDSFQWTAPFVDETPRDLWCRRETELVAIDALFYTDSRENFFPSKIRRELNKAYIGFHRPGVSPQQLSAVATGNWGCGAFRGDVQLKSLVQLMAAAAAGRDVAYFTFDSEQVMNDVFRIHHALVQQGVSIGRIYGLMVDYFERFVRGVKGQMERSLFDHIHSVLCGNP